MEKAENQPQKEKIEFLLVSLDTGGESVSAVQAIPICLGTKVIGRKELGDVRVSRKCAMLTLTSGEVGLELKIQRQAHSPVFLTRSLSDVVMLDKDKYYILKVDDIVSFGPQQHHYEVRNGHDQQSREIDNVTWDLIKDDRRSVIKKITSFECVLCLEELKIDFAQPLGCGHRFCGDCLKDYYVNCLEERKLPITCPGLLCTYDVTEQELQNVLDEPTLQKYQFYLLNLFMEKNSEEFSCCPTPNCSYMFAFSKGDHDFFCPKCKHRYCLNCKVEFHTQFTCAQYQQWKVANGEADAKFEDFAAGNKLKQCKKCKRWVEKKGGCNHITCPCGAQFCYVCGEVWGLKECRFYECRNSAEARNGATNNNTGPVRRSLFNIPSPVNNTNANPANPNAGRFAMPDFGEFHTFRFEGDPRPQSNQQFLFGANSNATNDRNNNNSNSNSAPRDNNNRPPHTADVAMAHLTARNDAFEARVQSAMTAYRPPIVPPVEPDLNALLEMTRSVPFSASNLPSTTSTTPPVFINTTGPVRPDSLSPISTFGLSTSKNNSTTTNNNNTTTTNNNTTTNNSNSSSSLPWLNSSTASPSNAMSNSAPSKFSPSSSTSGPSGPFAYSTSPPKISSSNPGLLSSSTPFTTSPNSNSSLPTGPLNFNLPSPKNLPLAGHTTSSPTSPTNSNSSAPKPGTTSPVPTGPFAYSTLPPSGNTNRLNSTTSPTGRVGGPFWSNNSPNSNSGSGNSLPSRISPPDELTGGGGFKFDLDGATNSASANILTGEPPQSGFKFSF